MRLSEDVYSMFRKGHLYGACGDSVTVISKHGDVVVVEGADKNRFPVEWAKLEPDPLPSEKKERPKPEPKEVVKPISKPTRSGKKKPAKVIKQNDLFQ